MTDKGFRETLLSPGNALDRLGEAIDPPVESDDLVVDATIKRIEFTYGLTWKTLRKLSRIEGLDPRSPRELSERLIRWDGSRTTKRGCP